MGLFFDFLGVDDWSFAVVDDDGVVGLFAGVDGCGVVVGVCGVGVVWGVDMGVDDFWSCMVLLLT